MELHERLKGWLNQDILIEFLVYDDKGYPYDTKGKLTEVDKEYFIINECDEGGGTYLGEKLYLFRGILSISLYRNSSANNNNHSH